MGALKDNNFIERSLGQKRILLEADCKMWRAGAVPPRCHAVRRGQGKCRSAAPKAVKPETSSAAINQILIVVVLDIMLTVRVVSDSRIKLTSVRVLLEG